MKNTAKLVLVRGIPGSGKSTFAKSVYPTYEHLETDLYFMQDRGYVFEPAKLKQAHEWCQATTRKRLEDGECVVVSNTFIKMWELRPYLDMAKELGVPVKVFHMKGEYGSVHNVPEEVIARMKLNYEPYHGEACT